MTTMTLLGMSSSLFSLLFVMLIAVTVAAIMWSAQVIAEERRNLAGRHQGPRADVRD